MDEKKGKTSNKDNFCRTQRDAAKFLGISTRQIRRYIKEGFRLTKEGFYDRMALKAFHDAKGHKPNETRTRQDVAEADLKEAKARLTELELEIKRGEWIRKAEIDKRNAEKVMALKRTMLGFGRSVAPLVVNKKKIKVVQLIIDTKIKSMIRDFARQ